VQIEVEHLAVAAPVSAKVEQNTLVRGFGLDERGRDVARAAVTVSESSFRRKFIIALTLLSEKAGYRSMIPSQFATSVRCIWSESSFRLRREIR
jgi:hypothetical protein